MSKTVFMRGLNNFIQEIRACQGKEQEERRVEKELGKIRAAFGDDKNLSGYDKRKYVWKLLYIYMMGYKIDFGHKQACDLIPKPKYKDKQVGYMACSILLHENDEFLRLVINGVHMDLTSRNEAFECLALSFLGSVGGSDMVDAVVPGILKLLSTGASRPVVKKRAALCLLRMIRKAPQDHPVVNPDTFCSTLNDLMEERDIGLLLSVVTLFCGILAKQGPGGYESCQSRLIKIIDRMTHIRERDIPAEYLYYGIPSPWLQAKSLRALQFFPAPEIPADKALLKTVMHAIVENPMAFAEGKSSNPNKANALFAMIFEAVSLALHLDSDPQLLGSCSAAMGRLLSSKEPNIRFLALESLSRMAALPSLSPYIRQFQPAVQQALKDPDASIRRRAMDLECALCDSSNVQALVAALLAQHNTEFPMTRDMVLRIAGIAEKHAPNVQWYVDTCYQLLERFGDFAPDEMWHRLVTAVGATPTVQPQAARGMVEMLRRGATHESVACTGAYILGEYCGRIKAEVPPQEQFKLLNRLFPPSSPSTKGLLMTAFIKIFLQDHQNRSLRFDVATLFESNQKFMEADQQQRAAELLALADDPNTPVAQLVLPMPKFPEQDTAALLIAARGSSLPSGTSHAPSGGASGSGLGALLPTSSEPQPPSEPSPSTAAAAAARSAPSFDLLGEEAILPSTHGGDSSSGGAGFGASDSAAHASSAPQPPAARPSPVDLLSDLFGDAAVVSAPAAAAPAAAAPPPLPAAPLANNPFASALPIAAAAPVAPSPFFPGAPLPLPPPAAPALPAPSSNNPFASAWPAAPVAAFGEPLGAPAALAAPAPFPAAPPVPQPPAAIGGGPLRVGDPFSELTTTALAAPATAGWTAAPAAPAAAPAAAAAAAGGWAAGPGGWPAPAAPAAAAPAGWGSPDPTSSSTSSPLPAGAASSAGVSPVAAPWPAAGAGPLSPSFAAAAPAAEAAPAPWAAPVPAAAAAPAATAMPAPWAPAPAPVVVMPAPVVLPPPPPPAPALPYFEPAQPTGDVQRWFNALLYKDRGVLYEDQYLQVGVQSQYSEGLGDFTLYLGNKNGEYALEQVSVSASSTSAVAATVADAAPRQMAPQEQVQVPVKLTCLGPVEEVPTLTVSYQLGNVSVAQQLRVPVANHRFLVPEPAIAKELFFEQWRELGHPPNKAQEMVTRESPVASESIVAILRQAQLGVEHQYLDPNPHNEAGAAYFTSKAYGRTLVMCRVEGNPQNMSMFRVTVVSALPAVSTSTKDLIVARLTALPA